MRVSSLITLLLAVLLAGVAGFMAQRWLEYQRRSSMSAATQDLKRATVVIATRPLRFGTPLNETNVREMEWPSGSIPDGALRKLGDVLKSGERRIALAAIEPNELILGSKITGPGQRPSLSALLADGMKAVTIRVNDVHGVAGFVLPNDRVDVILTRKAPDAGQKADLVTEVLLQGIKVLAIDQLADDRLEKATIAKAVTVEVTTEDAQRIVLASTVGTLSLALRGSGSEDKVETGRITPLDLTRSRAESAAGERRAVEPGEAAPVALDPIPHSRSFGVTRSTKRTEYNIPDAVPEPLPAVVSPPKRSVPDTKEPTDPKSGPDRPKAGRLPSQPLRNSWSIETR